VSLAQIDRATLPFQFQARMRFLAFTSQFVERQYEPLAAGKGA
jgi:hypothetical protein